MVCHIKKIIKAVIIKMIRHPYSHLLLPGSFLFLLILHCFICSLLFKLFESVFDKGTSTIITHKTPGTFIIAEVERMASTTMWTVIMFLQG